MYPCILKLQTFLTVLVIKNTFKIILNELRKSQGIKIVRMLSQKLMKNNRRRGVGKNVKTQRIQFSFSLLLFSSLLGCRKEHFPANSSHHCLLPRDSLTNSCFIALFIAPVKGTVRQQRITHIYTTY